MASELAPGSEWIDTSIVSVRDVDGCEIYAFKHGSISVLDPESGNATEVYARDVIAVIDKADLDPVRVAARELVELCKPVNMHSDIGRRSIIEAAEKLKGLL